MAERELRIGVIGAGVMGSGIAQTTAIFGCETICADVSKDALARAREGVVSEEEVNPLRVDCFRWPVGPFAMLKGATSGWS